MLKDITRWGQSPSLFTDTDHLHAEETNFPECSRWEHSLSSADGGKRGNICCFLSEWNLKYTLILFSTASRAHASGREEQVSSWIIDTSAGMKYSAPRKHNVLQQLVLNIPLHHLHKPGGLFVLHSSFTNAQGASLQNEHLSEWREDASHALRWYRRRACSM